MGCFLDPHSKIQFLFILISNNFHCKPGAHLEGPFINPNMKGAHKAHLMRQLSTKGAQEIEDFYGSLEHVSIITLAPELAGENMESIKQLVDKNIVVSIGKCLLQLWILLIKLK